MYRGNEGRMSVVTSISYYKRACHATGLTYGHLQVREEYPICVQSQNTTKHKTKFITLLQHYNNMFRPKLSAIVRLYLRPIVIIIIIGIRPLGRSGQRPEFSQATGMALVRCILGKFLGVACHCFPPRPGWVCLGKPNQQPTQARKNNYSLPTDHT